MNKVKPLDFVRTKDGEIALVTEMNYPTQEGMENQYALSFIGGGAQAWYDESILTVLDSLPSLLSRNMVHPSGKGKECALDAFPLPPR